MTMTTTIGEKPVTAKKSTAKPSKPGRPVGRIRTSALPPLEPEMMNDILLAIHESAKKTDDLRALTDAQIAITDGLIREAVDDGERYRDIAAAADRTVPWVQMSLRRAAGVGTHPAEPIPDTRIRRRKAS